MWVCLRVLVSVSLSMCVSVCLFVLPQTAIPKLALNTKELDKVCLLQ